MRTERRYPVGIQTFKIIREGDYLYFDKTGLIHELVSRFRYVFLSRPRRFGKSLLVSTMQTYFEGRKELFEGLAIEGLEREWETYPVLRLDFSSGSYTEVQTLMQKINNSLLAYEQLYGLEQATEPHNVRMLNIIRAAYQQTGKPVVVLVDEYDAPMLRSFNDPALQSQLRDIMRNLFSPLKEMDPYLRFVFLTGITKFSQMSIFSELNNLNNISLDDEYAALCGVTEEEMRTQCQPGIEAMAQKNHWSYEQTLERLKQNYDGYHFAPNSPDLYNPFSLLSAFSKRKLGKFWFDTGTPTFLLDLLRQRQLNMEDVDGIKTLAEQFDQSTETVTDPIPVLYQSGYLTIKDYDLDTDTYTLGFPNEEVRSGFANSLLQHSTTDGNEAIHRSALIVAYRTFLRDHDLPAFIEAIRVFFATIPYDLHGKGERAYHALLYTALAAAGADVRSEVKTSQGRIDLVVPTRHAVLLFELKLNKTAEEAISQIRDKQYDLPFALDNRTLYRIGLNFSSETRTIENYIIV